MLLILALLGAALTGPAQTPPKPAPAYRLEAIAAAAALPDARQPWTTADTLLRLPWPPTQLVAKRRGVLTLPVRGGSKVFRDYHVGTDFDDQVSYRHRGYLPAVRLHLIEVHFYESSEWWLVSYDTGALTRLWNLPQFSPDGRRVAAYSRGLEYGAVPNGVQVFRVEPGRLSRLVELRPEQWEPARLVWRDNRSLDVQALATDLTTKVYKRLTLLR